MAQKALSHPTALIDGQHHTRSIAPGDTAAFVGSSGSGKSTLPAPGRIPARIHARIRIGSGGES